jgi:hypothetical protein
MNSHLIRGSFGQLPQRSTVRIANLVSSIIARVNNYDQKCEKKVGPCLTLLSLVSKTSISHRDVYGFGA